MKYQISQLTRLESTFIQEWERAWLTSQYGHIFNSPYWFQACLEINPDQPILILVCRDNQSNLVGILPLIQDKKFGFSVYLSPGHKYLDKSTLLLVNGEINVFHKLINELGKIGSYYLTEVSERLAKEIDLKQYGLGISLCSVGSSLELESDPLRFLSKENRRRLLKRIREESDIKYINERFTLNHSIDLARSIEIDSNKARDHKDIFSDPYLIKLCEGIERIKPGIISFDFLYKNELPICYKYGFITHGTYHYSNTAYRVTYRKLSPGRILMILIIQELQKLGVKRIDFSRGDTSFKREFTDFTYRQYTMYHQRSTFGMLIWRFMYLIKELIKL